MSAAVQVVIFDNDMDEELLLIQERAAEAIAAVVQDGPKACVQVRYLLKDRCFAACGAADVKPRPCNSASQSRMSCNHYVQVCLTQLRQVGSFGKSNTHGMLLQRLACCVGCHFLVLATQAIATVAVDQMGGPAPAHGALRASWAAASASVKRKHNSFVVCTHRVCL